MRGRYLAKVVLALPIDIFEAQNVALVVNAFAKAGLGDEALYTRMVANPPFIRFTMSHHADTAFPVVRLKRRCSWSLGARMLRISRSS